MNIDNENIKSVSQKQLYIQFKTNLAKEDDLEIEIKDFTILIDENEGIDLKDIIIAYEKTHHIE